MNAAVIKPTACMVNAQLLLNRHVGTNFYKNRSSWGVQSKYSKTDFQVTIMLHICSACMREPGNSYSRKIMFLFPALKLLIKFPLLKNEFEFSCNRTSVAIILQSQCQHLLSPRISVPKQSVLLMVLDIYYEKIKTIHSWKERLKKFVQSTGGKSKQRSRGMLSLWDRKVLNPTCWLHAVRVNVLEMQELFWQLQSLQGIKRFSAPT